MQCQAVNEGKEGEVRRDFEPNDKSSCATLIQGQMSSYSITTKLKSLKACSDGLRKTH